MPIIIDLARHRMRRRAERQYDLQSREQPGRRCGRHARLRCVLAAALLLASSIALSDEPLRVIVPLAESTSDVRASYPLAALRLALERSGHEFRLQQSAAPMQQARALRMLADGRQLDVAWTTTTAAREAQLRPIRFPIDFGLIGWRVLLIRRGDAARFAAIESVRGLASLVAGQGHDWPDVDVLRANGLRVTPVTTYEGLFAMLARGRIDYFPRAVTEVRGEIDERAALAIELEPRLLLHYPSALYFFVNAANRTLATALESGLERSLADGSLRTLFDHSYAGDLAALRLPGRRVLELQNRALPPATPLARRELWLDPAVASP